MVAWNTRMDVVLELSCEDSRSRTPSPTDCASIEKEPQESSYVSSEQNDRIVINVGGCRHETFRSTLRIFPDTRLGWIAIKGKSCIDAYDPIRDEYFFDRHPHAFSQIINYYRTGKLHAPSDICGPMFEAELSYWGLNEKIMEPCCWSKYTEHRDAEENLKVFDNQMLRPQEEQNFQEFYYLEEKNTNANNTNNAMLDSLNSSVWNKNKTSSFFRFKKKVWLLFEKHNSCLAARIISMVSLLFILLSVLSLCFQTMLEIAHPNQLYSDLLLSLDIASFVWLVMELFLRFISAPSKTSFLLNFLNLIDLIVIIPYLGHFCTLGRNGYIKQRTLGVWNRSWFHVMAIARLFRLFRFFRLSTGLQILKHTLIASSKELLLLLLLLAIPVAIFATIVFYCENSSSNSTKFKTIPESFWWAVVTMTTVGYGDIVPTTTIGKFFGVLCALCGVLIIALPVSIIGNNFKLFYHYAQARLKQPFQQKSALVGAANALVSESINQAHGINEDQESSHSNSTNVYKDITQSKRFQRERSSLYVTTHTQKISPRRTLSESFTINKQDNAFLTMNKSGKSIQNNVEKAHINGGFSSAESIGKIDYLSEHHSLSVRPNSEKIYMDSKRSSITSSGFCAIPMSVLSPCELVENINDESSDLQDGLSKPQKPMLERNGSNLKTELNFQIQNLNDYPSNGCSKIDFVQNKMFLYKDNRKRSNNHLHVPEPEGLHELLS
ncbi:potassium voltage-gated channel protein Shaw isoform X2 [Hydra vulgaris]|uniref:Potassium voltage-gated channel protein Shaw isoform X2 n=1 Tax=Hydra vulgaris TaxID=6087 RepID=A0ABM4DGD1_HYDVU